MKREKTPSFILELALVVSPKEEKELLSRFESARNIYNALLGEAIKKVRLIKQSKLFQKAKKISKGSKKRSKERAMLFQMARDTYNFSDYSLQAYSVELRHKLANNLDVHTVQKLAKRAYNASDKVLYGTAKKVRFKSYNQLGSVESKNNEAGIRWRKNRVEWNGLSLKSLIYVDDVVVKYGLQKRVKYCRIVRKSIRGNNRFYVQLVLEGKPLIKEKNKLGNGVVGIDIGTSSVAAVAVRNEEVVEAILVELCKELKSKEKAIRRLQQTIDRQRKQSNSNNYLPNGKPKKGRSKWKKSNRQKKNEKALRELHRTTADHRKSLQGNLINKIIGMGNKFKTEDVSGKWLQKKFGKSVGTRAPGMLISGVERKAVSAGGSFMRFSTWQTALSQRCICGKRKKKPLSERVHECDCKYKVCVQRDLLSGYEACFVEEVSEGKYVFQANQAAKVWTSADALLQAAWKTAVQSANGKTCLSAFGKQRVFQSKSGSLAEEGIAKFEVQDVVVASLSNESLKENEVVSFRTHGVLTPV